MVKFPLHYCYVIVWFMVHLYVLCFILFFIFYFYFFFIHYYYYYYYILMFYLHICTLCIQLTPVHINPVTDTHRMLLSSEYNSLHFIGKYDYLKQVADTETVNNWIMSQLINNIFISLQLFQRHPIRQWYTIKPPFPGRHFTFTITFDSLLPFKLQAILRFQLPDAPLNYNVLMFSL
jgi:hypothetical protein